MKKSLRNMLLLFITPIVIIYLVFFLFPTIRTIYMSFFKIPGLVSNPNTWKFVGFENYVSVLNNSLFRLSYKNMLIILFVGGVFTMVIAMLFALVLNKGMPAGKMWKCLIYLPEVITPVALVVMWTQYALNSNFGLFKTIFDFMGLHKIADIPWTSSTYSFRAMLLAYTFGGIGYYMIIFMAALDKIPDDLPDSASIEGANDIQILFHIKLPLMKDVTKISMIFWCLGSINFFLWSKVFSLNAADPNTEVPAVFMYDKLFGNSDASSLIVDPNAGLGTAVGVILCINVIIVFGVFELIFGKEKYEY